MGREKNILLKQVSKSRISGICIYKGRIKALEYSSLKPYDEIQCETENTEPTDQKYMTCFQTHVNIYGYGSMLEAKCGPGPSREAFVLKVTAQTANNINKVYDGDRFKFSGDNANCSIYFTEWENKKIRQDLIAD